jgi:hypothetical protein
MRSLLLPCVLLLYLGVGLLPGTLFGQTRAAADATLAVPQASGAPTDTLPRSRTEPRLEPARGLLPAIAAGAVLGVVARSVRPDCVLPTSSAQAAVVGAIWGGLQQKIGVWKRRPVPTQTHADPPRWDRPALEELCGQRPGTSAAGMRPVT